MSYLHNTLHRHAFPKQCATEQYIAELSQNYTLPNTAMPQLYFAAHIQCITWIHNTKPYLSITAPLLDFTELNYAIAPPYLTQLHQYATCLYPALPRPNATMRNVTLPCLYPTLPHRTLPILY